ncbi:hypothetical protein BJ973_001007 [Actinoplanes tereljensis]|uniref:Uncharacterized protein n=1 Tax=Paractinoplanes tereljensis TaxID=571912 RepID=A0A919NY89_9ACTN|nr:DUF6767 domain-containing protein [Actinoplanes tereljensis]GIF26563.1 hypothetical protein Ate02nite_92930 [Actinoplanes tereljensis]
MTAWKPDERCPLRPGEHCRLCQLGATGPQDCPLVYLVMTDDELRAGVQAAALRAPAGQPSASRARPLMSSTTIRR